MLKHHQMMLEDGCPAALLRLPGQPAPQRPAPPVKPTPPPVKPAAIKDDATLRHEADTLWRNWIPTRESRSRPRKATFLKQLRDEQKAENPMAKIGPKEQQRRDLRERNASAGPKKVHGLAAINAAVIRKIETPTALAPETKPEPTAQPEASTQENDDMRRAPKAKKAAKAKKTAKRKASTSVKGPTSSRPDGLRDGSKQATMLDMVLRPEGATEEAICEKLEWKACAATLRRVCEKVGATIERKDGRFFAAMKVKRQA